MCDDDDDDELEGRPDIIRLLLEYRPNQAGTAVEHLYTAATAHDKGLINNIAITLCGWSAGTLIVEAKQGIDPGDQPTQNYPYREPAIEEA